MAVKIGSARSSYGNTSAGDQNGGKEVSTQNWYNHSKGWVVIRAIDPVAREKIAVAMEHACGNDDIGYSQTTRGTLRANVADKGFDPALTTKKVNCDCSSLVRVCVNYADIDVENFRTATETNILMATGAFELFTNEAFCATSEYLLRGDILNTRTSGHTVVVLSDGIQAGKLPINKSYVLGERILKNGCTGDDVKELQKALIQLGYTCGPYGTDGDYGDATELAVIQFQKDHILEADGDYGPITHKAMLEALSGTGEKPETAVHVRIEGGNCFVREEPSTKGKKLGVAYRNETFSYAGARSEAGWLMILYENRGAWVSGKYGKLKNE